MPTSTRPAIDVARGDTHIGAAEPTLRHDLKDVLVFEHSDRAFVLVGGVGRGAGWAGIVEVETADAAAVGRAWHRGSAERISGSAPTQIIGPYYARYAVAVPVGQQHVVVFGSEHPVALRDSDLIRQAAAAVNTAHRASPDKLLADELEVVQALRSLTAYRPLTVRDTARHIATVAAQALSCDVAVIRVELDGQALVEGLDLRSMRALDNPDSDGHLATMSGAAAPSIEQVAPPHPDIFGVDVASQMMLPLAGGQTGALALGHAATHARGFTSLCQRIGRAIADASELLIGQAHAREQLAAERDLLARLVRTDALTGVPNRRAWDDAVALSHGMDRGVEAFVVSCDIDGLKATNDSFGHEVGDALIRAAANMLRSCVRESDLMARIGGDEFVILLNPADASVARRVVARIRRAERTWRVTEHALSPRLSVGLARVVDGDLERARADADRSMYANKRRRARLATRSSVRHGDRRRRSRPI